MAERRQKLRGTTTQLDQEVGLVALLAYDTNRQELRVFDGVLMGGYRIPNLTTIDALYKLPERLTVDGKSLDGVSANTALESGFYQCTATTTNTPVADIATLLVEATPTMVTQTWTRDDNSARWRRTKIGAAAFSSWEFAIDFTWFTTNAGAVSYDAARLGGQLPAYYTNIVARLGYTPVNKAGDTGIGNLSMGALTATDGVFSGGLTVNGNQITVNGANPRILLADTNASAHDFWMFVDANQLYFLTDRANDGSWETPHPGMFNNNDSQFYIYGSKAWHEGNDGPGTGLNADLLDNQDSSYYTAITARLGYTPVRQGGGAGQMSNTVYIGWSASSFLRVQVDGSDFDERWPIHIRGAATKLYQGGNIGNSQMAFHWNGQAGQPPWLWGGSDGLNHYVYNPSNFNVNYANSSGYADTVDGYHATDLSQIYKGSDVNELNFPLGHIIMCTGGTTNRNQTATPYNRAAAHQYTTSVVGSPLAGTWRARGQDTDTWMILQRVA